MNNLRKISTFEAISLIVIVMLNNIILNIPTDIIKSTSSASWLNVILISILAILFTLLICKLFKDFPSMDIIDISETLAGKPLKYAIGVSFIVLFIIFSSNTLRIFSDLLQVIFLKNTPLLFILTFFIIGIISANKLGIFSIAKVSTVAFTLGIFSFSILILALSQNYYPANLFPILRLWCE